jgi:nitrogenase molybdenum-iron protein alpha/beta subunit
MKADTLAADKTFKLPYQLGVYLAANAVSDAALIVDGPNCSIPKAEFIYGNHDLRSTLFSPSGEHRLFYTMTQPLRQSGNPESLLSVLLDTASRSELFGVIMVTALPFMKLAGQDYDGLAARAAGRTPVTEVPAGSLEGDWLDGYARSLAALARALPPGKAKRRKRSVAVAGYLMDRNEGDHAANIEELRGLLELCGLELACVFPGGGNFKSLAAALTADVVVSLPYGREAASLIAARSGARLVETELPLGVKGTAAWLAQVCAAAGVKPGAAAALAQEQALAALRPALAPLRHKNAVFAGDPYLYTALAAFLKELGMRPDTAFCCSSHRRLASAPARLLFAPAVGEARNAVAGLEGFEKPAVLIGNSFARSEDFAPGVPFVELGFPSYGRHCLTDQPFLGYAGALRLAERLLNSQLKF